MYIIANCLAIIIVCYMHYNLKVFSAIYAGDTSVHTKTAYIKNPLKTIEPIGFLLLFATGFGWSKTFSANTYMFKDRKKGTIFANVFPTLVILICGIISLISLKFVYDSGYIGLYENGLNALLDLGSNEININMLFAQTIYMFGYYSISFFIINFLPIYPFNGYDMFSQICSPDVSMKITNYEKLAQIIFVFLVLTNFVRNILNVIILNVMNFFI